MHAQDRRPATGADSPAGGAPSGEDLRDLGFGVRVAQDSRRRLLNRDGTFNVQRSGLPFWRSFSPYHAFVDLSWPRFLAAVACGYLAVNLAFAAAYLACGEGALEGGQAGGVGARFADAFFFSVQTLATIGYGRLIPKGTAANLLVALEALVGIVGFAIVTGLAYARFARPGARVMFSTQAVVAPHRDGRALMFRLANERRGRSQLLLVEALVILARFVERDGRRVRVFEPLALERPKVMFLPLHWTVVHPIAEDSPLRALEARDLQRDDAEVLVLLSAVDEVFGQTVHARTSYKADEIVFGARFADMFQPSHPAALAVDLRRLHAIEPA